MAGAIARGTLKRWDDERGFGFIRPEPGGQEVFVHASALAGMSRRPVVGDILLYTPAVDADGRIRAVDAIIEGVPGRQKPPAVRSANPAPQRSPFPSRSSPKPRKPAQLSAPPRRPRRWLMDIGLPLALVAIFAAYGKLMEYRLDQGAPLAQRAPEQEAPAPSFQCEGKTRCPEMSSCAEAVFYLQNCPGTQMDGDHDGTPCEDQWCGH